MKFFFVLCLLLHSPLTFSKRVLLDKILGVFNGQTISLSQIKRIRQTLPARINISPQIYTKSKYSMRELVELNIRQLLIREEISRTGYVINDGQVESQIKETEKRIGTTRKELLNFLKSHNVSFGEYFEITRATIEYNIFTSRVIAPLVSVTEQEIKKAFYKKNVKNRTLDMKYTLVDFSIDRKALGKKMKTNFRNIVKKFQSTGSLVLPEKFPTIHTNYLGNITEDGLTKRLKKVLKKTSEGDATPPLLIGSKYHVFWVKKKDVVESEFYRRTKNRIRQKLAEKAAIKIESDWFNRNKEKHHIRYYL